MVLRLGNPRELGRYLTLAQVGLEMVVPIVVGLLLDLNLGWTPWGVVVGAALGFTVGLVHLVRLVNRPEPPDESPPPPPESPAP